ncbi:hypothetical protein NE865_16016 [Phthorimaea operculella]|nr:hypothetical protein NE865_16016 [Phthorimaea operculella]
MPASVKRLESDKRCLMFADDLKLFQGVSGEVDVLSLQADIDAVHGWSKENNLEFNASKCKVITFTRSRQPLIATYTLPDDGQLERVCQIRDLGLMMDARLDFREHITSICKASNKTLGFMMRVTSQFNDVRAAKTLYNAYVRSKLEFGAIVWAPYETKYSLTIEKIQRKFARWVFKRENGYYPYLYPSLFVSGMVGLDTLMLRRRLLLVTHYFGLLNNRINNISVTERIGLVVPSGGTRSCCGYHRDVGTDCLRAKTNAPVVRTMRLLLGHSHSSATSLCSMTT